MNKRDIKNYNKSQKIVQEIIHAMDGSVKNEEARELKSFLESNIHAEKFLEKSCDEEKFKNIRSELDDAVKNRKLESFLEKLDDNKPTHSKRYIIRSLATLAATAAVILLAFIVYNYNNDNKEQTIKAQNLEKPTLILSDGDKIDLEDLTQGVTKNRDIVIVKDSNQIRYSSEAKKNIKYNALIVPKKYSYSIVLSDGSEVRLNAGSELVYPENFGGDIRKVELKGEAYFKVKKSEEPFVVRVNGSSIRVYGTEFNVNCSCDSVVETTLISGSVGVKPDSGDEIMIKPNQMVSMDKYTKRCIVRDVNVENYISWMNGYFRYIDYSFESIVNDISVWYGVQITLSKELLISDLLATISISRDISLEEMLRFVEKIMSVKIIYEGGGRYMITK